MRQSIRKSGLRTRAALLFIGMFLLGQITPRPEAFAQTVPTPPEDIQEHEVCGAVSLEHFTNGDMVISIQVPAENNSGHTGWTYSIYEIVQGGRLYLWGPQMYIEPAQLKHTIQSKDSSIYRVIVHPPSTNGDGLREIVCLTARVNVDSDPQSDFSQLMAMLQIQDDKTVAQHNAEAADQEQQTDKVFLPTAAK